MKVLREKHSNTQKVLGLTERRSGFARALGVIRLEFFLERTISTIQHLK